MAKDFIFTLYNTPQTVFSLSELSLLFPELSYNNLRRKAHYFVQVGKLQSPRKGIYAKEKYNLLEMANKIYTPSYISFETVLQKAGIIFQVYNTIFVASYLSRKITVGEQEVYFRKMKEEVLTNTQGIEQKENYAIASSERAFLDAVFRYGNYYFDNLQLLNWEKVFSLITLYNNKAFEKRVNSYYKEYKKNNV